MKVVDDGGSVGGGIQLGLNDFEFEFSHILWEIVIIADSGIGEPGGGFCSGVGALEGGLKIFDEIGEGLKGRDI